MSYTNEINLLNDFALQARIVRSAHNFISTELPKETYSTPNFENRLNFGTLFVQNDQAYTKSLINQVLATDVIVSTSTDQEIDARVAAVWDIVAGGNVYKSKINIAMNKVAAGILADPAADVATKTQAQKMFRDQSGYTNDAAAAISLQLAEQNKDALSATIDDLVAIIKLLIPTYVPTAI